MDIAALSTNMAQSKLMNSVGCAMLGKVLDQTRQSGSQITELLESAPAQNLELSVNPNIGGQFDMSV